MQDNAKIAFLDTEISTISGKIENIGLLFDELCYEGLSLLNLKEIFDKNKIAFICGHNFVNFDKKYLEKTSFNTILQNIPIIDTLYLSLLLAPDKTKHKLDKPYKREIQRESPENSPLEDAKSSRALFYHLNEIFDKLPLNLQVIFEFLLKDDEKFKGFFLYKQSPINKDFETALQDEFKLSFNHIESFLSSRVELALVLSFMRIFSQDSKYFSPYILKNHSTVTRILKALTKKQENLKDFAKNEFGIFEFRSFKALQKPKIQEEQLNLMTHKDTLIIKDEFSQKDLIESALKGESFLAILPTGGGKTFSFQMPALISARQYKGLTVVISPLQALMKNHIDSFKLKNQNFTVEALSGFLDPMQRAENYEKLLDGSISILYLSPESLRSNAIFKALQRRYIERFVIDEAHCFSMWGHNFRQDYHFIAQTIKDLEQSPHQAKIPVSCFTATAKPEVIEDIKAYFKQEPKEPDQAPLNLDLKEFVAATERKELIYELIEVIDEKDKKDKLFNILFDIYEGENKHNKNPTIIYIPQNARKCKELRDLLREKCLEYSLSWKIEAFYARLDDDISRLDEDKRKDKRSKGEILQDFIADKIDIIIATTAFGMGIDKPNITTIIHYELSDSLESYIQESGRGARDKKYQAKCYILYDKNDIDKNFAHLRRSNLDLGEIQKLAAVLKNEYNTRKKNPLLISLKQLHKKMGKSEEEFEQALIKTALLELEKAGLLQRKRVSTKIYASAFKLRQDKMAQARTVLDPQKERLEAKTYELNEGEKNFLRLYKLMILIMQNIIQKSKQESTVSLDELSDLVGGVNERDLIKALELLSQNELISKENDIRVLINIKKAQKKMREFLSFEMGFFELVKDDIKEGRRVDLRLFNDEELKKFKLDTKANPLYTLKFIINSWKRLLQFTQKQLMVYFKQDLCVFEGFNELDKLKKIIEVRERIFTLMLEIIKEKYMPKNEILDKEQELFLPSKELYELINEKEKFSQKSFAFLLKNMDELLEKDFEITGGRLIYHQKECLEFTNKEDTSYSSKDYKASLKKYQTQRIINAHILQAFLNSFLTKNKDYAMGFMKDYFILPQSEFFKHYNIDKEAVKNPISKDLLARIIKDLNLEQEKILKDDKNKAIMILAGPGSGKTRTLVHKIAYLLTAENKKSENFLMLAHSKVAVREFKERLYKLLGALALNVRIMTFHAFALHLRGVKVNKEEELKDAIELATSDLKNNELSLPYIDTLMLDEYQDINSQCYEFIKAIYENMSGKKQIIAVGDDDQLINDFNGADIKFLKDFEKDFTPNVKQGEDRLFGIDKFASYSLMTNYRSNKELIAFNNAYRRAFLKEGLKGEDLRVNPNNKQAGFISFTRHSLEFSLSHLASKASEFINQKARKSVAVLVRSNDEVLALAYEFQKLGIRARLILEKEGFELKNLIELFEYVSLLKDGTDQNEARLRIKERYKNSLNLEIFEAVIELFEKEQLRYERDERFLASDFESFLEELSFESLENFKNTLIISTMHKAKGKEFDNVFVGLNESFEFHKPSERRLLYVAFTRAKERLFVHSKNDFLSPLKEYFNEALIYDKKDDKANKISLIMSLKDLILSDTFAKDKDRNFIKSIQDNINSLQRMGVVFKAGEYCEVRIKEAKDKTYINLYYQNKAIASLSQSFREKIFAKKGYILESKAKISYVVKWFDKQTKEDLTQILCELSLRKQG
ncbi:DEAD/DEAH box helicase [Campylobacter troglodytis]|uniref:DEAD/DEAH box helicase n=1 Tax=Campylobacter troglodytis TaxID=654363 RepID=UPI00163BFA9C|nr:DEAD/DEAH box helicase [Campylobacter troglodytis]